MRTHFKIFFDIYFEQTNRAKTCRGLDCKNSLLIMFVEQQKNTFWRKEEKRRDICSVLHFGDDSDNQIIRSREPDKPPLLNCFLTKQNQNGSLRKHVFVLITKYYNSEMDYFEKQLLSLLIFNWKSEILPCSIFSFYWYFKSFNLSCLLTKHNKRSTIERLCFFFICMINI
jgi:hypothetical protein